MPGPLLLLGEGPAAALRNRLRQQIEDYSHRHGPVHLRILRWGDDLASASYARAVQRTLGRLGVQVEITRLAADVAPQCVHDEIVGLNRDPKVHGVIVAEPRPPQIEATLIGSVLAPAKDPDCVTPARLGAHYAGHSSLAPATAAAVIAILDHYRIAIEGKRAVVIGRSNVAGKPAAMLLLARNATVTICHTRTKDLAAELRRAEIIVAAAGAPGLVKGDDVSEGVVVVDVGTNYTEAGLVGDVEFATVAPKAAAITPVPRGVGPLTNVMLAANLVALLQEQS